jgi:carboxypeptidase PM20D1
MLPLEDGAMEILIGLLILIATILTILAVGAAGPPWQPPPHDLDDTPVDGDRVARLLSGYVAIDTSNPPGLEDWPRTRDMPAHVAYLLKHWVEPLGLEHRLLPGGSLAVFVPSDDQRRPVLMLSHADVVPIDRVDRERWTQPPFSGLVKDGFVWGRGTLDNKGSAVMYLEAVRLLIERGDRPSRKLVILVTADEETDGSNGSCRIVRDHLKELGNPEILLDEGSCVTPDFLPGHLVGIVAVAEKTFLTARLRVEGSGGHASVPTRDDPSAVLVRALERVVSWQTPARIHPIVREAMWRVGGAMGFPAKWLFRNPGVFRRVLLRNLQKDPGGNAVTRDVLAITMLRGGIKENIIPREVEAMVNARLMLGSSPEEFVDRLRNRINDERVQISPEVWPGRDRPTSWDTPAFRAIEAVASAVLGRPEAPIVMVPLIAAATTDSRYYAEAGLECYRFHPLVLDADELRGVHGVDERISISNLERGTRFYLNLIQVL